nr:transcription factor HIVEP3-like [Lytechinus pictus]
MKVKITDRVRQMREAKAQKDKRNKLTPETLGPLQVQELVLKQEFKDVGEKLGGNIVKEPVPDVVYKDKYDIIKERRARMSKAIQDQCSVSPSKAAKESVTTSPKKRQRHSSSGSQKSDTNVSVLRNSESGEEGALKQQALEALLEITGKEFTSMNSFGKEQHQQNVSTSEEPVITPHTPPAVAKQDNELLKSNLAVSHLMQFANNAQMVQADRIRIYQKKQINQNKEADFGHFKLVPHRKERGDSESQQSPKEGKHMCDYCGRRCSKPSVLKKHIRSHTGERPYPCTPCGISFKTKSNLYKHCKSHAHAAKAGFSGASPDLKPFDSDHESGSEETDTDEEGKDIGREQHENLAENHAQSTSLTTDQEKSMNMTSVQALMNGGRTSVPDSHPTFVPSSKAQASPIASQTGNRMWETISSSPHLGNRSSRDLHMLSQLSTDILNGTRERQPKDSLQGSYLRDYESNMSRPKNQLNDENPSSRPSETSTSQERSEAPSPNSESNSTDQIMIPLKNFNIVRSGGHYHFQIPVEGIPGLSEEVIKEQSRFVQESNDSVKERGEKSRPTLNSPSTQIKLQQHIQKLISQNEAIVDDSDLESVKPRRPSFSYRESMTSTPPQLPASGALDVRNDSKTVAESSVTMETKRRSELAEQTNLDSKQEVRGNQDRQREAQTLMSSQYSAHLHTGQSRHGLTYKAAEAGINTGHKLPTSSPVTLQQAVPGDGNIIRNILLEHKRTQQATPASMLGQSLPMDRQQYSPLWSPAQMHLAPWMLKDALPGGMRYPMPVMYPHAAMMQHLPTEHLPATSQSHQFMKESGKSKHHHTESGKSAHKRKKCKSESDASGSHESHHSRKKARKHHDHPTIKEEVTKGLPLSNAAPSHSMLPMFSPPFPGPDANQAAYQLPWIHASLPKGTSTPLRSPYSPKPAAKSLEANFPGVSVIQHTPTTPHTPTQFPSLPGQQMTSFMPEKGDGKRDSPAGLTQWAKEMRSSYQAPPGNMRIDLQLASPSVPHSPRPEGLLKVAPPRSPLTPKTLSLASPMIPSAPSTLQDKSFLAKELQNVEQMPVNEALARKKKSFTLALDDTSARASLQKRRNLPAIPGLNMSPGRSVPTKRTPGEQTHALDLTAKIQSMGSPMSAKIPRVDIAARSPAYTPTEGGKKFPKSPMKFGAGAAARHRLSLDLQQPLTAAVKGASTPDGVKPSPKIDPRVLLSPEALSIAESVMRMSQSPLKAKTPSTPVDAARELGRLVAHAFHNAGGSIKSVLTTSDEGMIVGPIATPTAEGKPQSKYFIMPSPSSSHAPSFPSSSSPRSEKSPLTPSDNLSPQGKTPSGKRDASFELFKDEVSNGLDNCEKTDEIVPSGSSTNLTGQEPLKPSLPDLPTKGDNSIADQVLKVLTPVLQQGKAVNPSMQQGKASTPVMQQGSRKTPKKLGKDLADWFSSVKVNKAGSGPALAPTFLYANISSRMKGVAQVTDCTSRCSQPMYVMQGSNVKISMYSNWRPGGNTKNPLGVSWREQLGLYNSGMNKENIKDVVSSISPSGGGILTHSSAWNMSLEKIKAVSEELQKQASGKPIQTPTETPGDEETPSSSHDSEVTIEKHVKGKEPKRIPIFEGGFKSNEEYVYVRGRGRGKYVCQECGIRCKKPSMLKKHIRTHTDVRPFQCSVCSFAFKTKGNLTKHMKSKAHTKKCLENGINPSDLEHEHGIDSSVYEDGDDHQYSDADDNEDTDSADEDSEEEEMDDGMNEEMEVDDLPQEHQDGNAEGDSVYHPGKLKRSYSEILKPQDLADAKDDLMHASKLTRSEVVCKLSQHLTNRQRAHVGQDRSHPPLTKSQSLSQLPTLKAGFGYKSSSRKSQPPPVLDKYGHIIALESFAPSTNHYRLATGNASITVRSSSTESCSSEGDHTTKDGSLANVPDRDIEQPDDVIASRTCESDRSVSNRIPVESSGLVRVTNTQDEVVTKLSARSSRMDEDHLAIPDSVPFKPHENLIRRHEKSDSRMRFYSPSSKFEIMPETAPPVIEPVSDDEGEGSSSRNGKPVSDFTSSIPSASSFQRTTMEASGNAIKQLLLAKPPTWSAPDDKTPLQRFMSPFLPPSPSMYNAPMPSPTTHLNPFSPGPLHRLVSPMLPSKMFQLPPTILPMHLPSSSGMTKVNYHSEKEKASSPIASEGDHADLISPTSSGSSESHLKDKQPLEHHGEEHRLKAEDRLAMSPTGNYGHHRCAQCGEAFNKPSQLRIHARIHTTEGTFTCHDCSLSFPSKYILSKHERSEEHFLRVEGVELATTTGSDSNPRPFKCKECAIAFRIPGHLAKHLRSKGHLMTLERQGKLPAHKQDLLHNHPDGDDGLMLSPSEPKAPGSPASSEKTDSASEAEEGKS